MFLQDAFAPTGHHHFVRLLFYPQSSLYFLVYGHLSDHLQPPCFPSSSPSPRLPRSQRRVLTACCHPSGLSSVAPGRLAKTAWDSAHFPALIIPACSAGTSPCLSGPSPPPLPPLLHLNSPFAPPPPPPLIQTHYCTPPFVPATSLTSSDTVLCVTSAVNICVTT